MKNENSITGQYLSGKKCIETPKERRKGKGVENAHIRRNSIIHTG